MSQTILITGGTGFAGSHLVEHLVAAGQTPHITTFSKPGSSLSQLLPADHIHQVNLTDRNSVTELLQAIQPTQIYHLAALANVANSFNQVQQVIGDNTNLQLNLLEAIKEVAPTCKTLIIGSAQEYDVIAYPGDLIDESHPLGPANPYGVSKVNQDLLALSYFYAYKLPIIRVRPFNHVGERQPRGFAISDFAAQIVAVERGQQTELSVGNLSAVRDICDVKDMVAAYEVAINQGQVGEVYNIGSGHGVSMSEVLEQLTRLSSTQINVVQDQAKFRPIDSPKIVANIAKISQLGWRPQHELSETLSRVVEFWRQQP